MYLSTKTYKTKLGSTTRVQVSGLQYIFKQLLTLTRATFHLCQDANALISRAERPTMRALLRQGTKTCPREFRACSALARRLCLSHSTRDSTQETGDRAADQRHGRQDQPATVPGALPYRL